MLPRCSFRRNFFKKTNYEEAIEKEKKRRRMPDICVCFFIDNTPKTYFNVCSFSRCYCHDYYFYHFIFIFLFFLTNKMVVPVRLFTAECDRFKIDCVSLFILNGELHVIERIETKN